MFSTKGKQPQKYTADVGMIDFYKYYCTTTFKEMKGKKSIVHKESIYNIDRKLFGEIVGHVNNAVIDAMIFDNLEFKMPARMGTLSIKKRKPASRMVDGERVVYLPVDWKSTKELWAEDEESKEQKRLVRYLNDHTKGFIAQYKYDRYPATYRFKTIYRFAVTRTNKQRLSEILLDPSVETNYYTIKR